MKSFMKSKTAKRVTGIVLTVAIVLGLTAFEPLSAYAHCDSVDGPIVNSAKKALETGDVKLVLPYVQKDGEKEVIEAFNKTLAVRKRGKDIQELADRYFYETIVRIHREGEKAPYTGLKPAGMNYGPALPAAEKALEIGSAEELKKLMHELLDEVLDKQFKEAMEVKKEASTLGTVEANREIVEAEFGFEKFILGIYDAYHGTVHHEGAETHAEEH